MDIMKKKRKNIPQKKPTTNMVLFLHAKESYENEVGKEDELSRRR